MYYCVIVLRFFNMYYTNMLCYGDKREAHVRVSRGTERRTNDVSQQIEEPL